MDFADSALIFQSPGMDSWTLTCESHRLQNTTDQFDLTPYYIPASGNYRYIMLEAANMALWLSYSEVEVYGY